MAALPARIDVAIVGGGFAGCATARELTRRGVSSVVLERERALGRFASGRGAGLGRQLAEDDATTALTIRGAARLRDELAAAWSPTGGILTFDDAAALDSYLARAARTGVDARLVDRAHVTARWPALAEVPILGGVEVASDGVIDAATLLELYAAEATVVLGAGVERIEPGGAGATVVTTQGSVEASLVVDAAGAWAGQLTGDPPLHAYQRHLYVLEATAGSAAPYVWHLGADQFYVRDFEGGVLVSACDERLGPPCDAVPDADGEPTLRTRLARVAPALAARPIARGWACQRSFTPERQMKLGRDPRRPWLVWAAALGGHGATASAAVGEVVAEAIVSAG